MEFLKTRGTILLALREKKSYFKQNEDLTSLQSEHLTNILE